MGTPIYTSDVIRVAFEGTVGARQWSNIVHYKFSGGGPSVGDLTTMGDALAGDWEALMTPFQDADTALTGVKLTDLTSALGAQTTVGADLVGTRDGAYLPASASVLVTYDVAVRYRGGHPRNYLSVGVQADLDTAQTWTADFATDVQNAWNELTAAPVGVTYGATSITTMGVVSLRTALAPRVSGVYYPYTGPGLAQVDLGSIRRRVRGRT